MIATNSVILAEPQALARSSIVDGVGRTLVCHCPLVVDALSNQRTTRALELARCFVEAADFLRCKQNAWVLPFRLAQGRMKTIWVMSSKIRPFASLRVTRVIDRSLSESSQFLCAPLTDSRTVSRHNLNLSFRMTKLKGDWLRAEG